MKYFNKEYKKNKNLFGDKVLEIVRVAIESGKLKGRTIDLGCGQGRNILYMLDEGFDVIGIDTSNQAIDALKNEFKFNDSLFILDDIKNITDYLFSNILATFTLNFLGTNQKSYIENIKKSTPLGGIHIIQDFIEKEDMVRNFLTIEEIKDLYKDWEIIFFDVTPIKTVLKDEKDDLIYFDSYRIIAKKGI